MNISHNQLIDLECGEMFALTLLDNPQLVDVSGIPVAELRSNSPRIDEIDVRNRGLGVVEILVLTDLIRTNTRVRKLDLSGNFAAGAIEPLCSALLVSESFDCLRRIITLLCILCV